MRIGGLAMVIERAVERVASPAVRRYRRAIVLGALREDVIHVPGLPRVFEHLSLSHFWGPARRGGYLPLWPGARAASDRQFARAVRAGTVGGLAAGFVGLGRTAHLLVDMACPVHVHRHLHDTDGYEWFVEGNLDELGALPAAPIPAASRASQLVESLARYTAAFPADRTQHAIGRWLVRRGLARSLPQAELRRAARAIIPVAIAHTAALLELYARTIDA